ncbi:MAG TPA: ABC transporter permease subunit [Thermotogota bacterium]|nr:ABC transporter permease subunit [Thermotogota bacterium]HRW91432.1 ABC transporter permease subunit [Thermotogota bacterium]
MTKSALFPFLRFFNRGKGLFVPFFLVSLFLTVLPLFWWLFSNVHQLDFSRVPSIWNDPALHLSKSLSLLYSCITLCLSFVLGSRIAYLLFHFRKPFQLGMSVLLLFFWALPPFISLPIFRLVAAELFSNLVASPWKSFATICCARVWLDLPLVILFCLSVFQKIPRSLLDSAKMDGVTRAQEFFLLFQPTIVRSSGLFLILFFLNNIRDVTVPWLMTNGRPTLAGGFSPYAITGSSTTLGFFLKQNAVFQPNETIAFTHVLFVTLLLLQVFLTLIALEKKRKGWQLVGVVSGALFFGNAWGFLLAGVYALACWKQEGFFLGMAISLEVLLALVFQTISPLPFLFLAWFVLFRFPAKPRGTRFFAIPPWVSGTLWIAWSAVLLWTILKTALSQIDIVPSLFGVSPLSLVHFSTLWEDGFFTNLRNSFWIGSGAGIISLLLIPPAAWAARMHRSLEKWGKGIALFTLVLTGMNTLVPLLVLFREVGLGNTFLPVWLTACNRTAPFGFFLVFAVLQGMDPGLEESARVEGATPWQILVKVLAPILRLPLLILFLNSFLNGWSSFLSPLVFLHSPRLFPVSLRLYDYAGNSTLAYPQWGAFCAGALVSAAVACTLAFPLQKWVFRTQPNL